MVQLKQSEADSTRYGPVGNSLGRSFLDSAESALAAQGEWLSTCEVVLTGWLNRRRAGLRAAMDAIEHVPECHTVADLLALQQQSIAESLQHLASEAAAWNETAMTISRLTMKYLEQTGRVATASASRGHADILRAAGNKPSR